MTLVCCKTGRFWRVHDHAHGDRTAARLGLKDYEVGPAMEGDR